MGRLMIDIEALGLEETCVVLSIGVFNMDTKQGITLIPNTEQQQRTGRTVDVTTVKWWMEQSQEARKVFSAVQQPAEDVAEALMNLIDPAQEIWANGVDYDFRILANFVKQYAPERRWPYWRQYDFRTLKNMVGVDKEKFHRGTAHDALDDAIFQARCLEDILRRIKLSG